MCKQKSSSIVQHIPTTYVELKSKFISTSMVPRYGTSPPQFQKLGGNNVGKCKNCFFSIMVIFYFISKLKVNSDQPSKKLYNQNSYYVSRYDINSCTYYKVYHQAESHFFASRLVVVFRIEIKNVLQITISHFLQAQLV